MKEEAKFWDTHSFADYWDEFEDVKVRVDLFKPKEEALVVRLQKEMKDRIARIAHRRGLNVSTLARMWLAEKLLSHQSP